MTKRKSVSLVTIALAVCLILAAANLNAASVGVLRPSGVLTYAEINKFTEPIFSFDLVLQNISPLANLDLWQLGLQISPGSDAIFSSANNVSGLSNYVFFGNSYDYQALILNPYQMTVGDSTANGTGVTDTTNKLLARILIDISNAEVGDIFTLSLFGPGSYTLFADQGMSNILDSIDLNYQFKVVPVPGAVWLLGTGLMGLVALRRRSKK